VPIAAVGETAAIKIRFVPALAADVELVSVVVVAAVFVTVVAEEEPVLPDEQPAEKSEARAITTIVRAQWMFCFIVENLLGRNDG
jgi:hypothetical protein